MAWRDEPVGDAVLQELYGLMRLGPTSANCCPARIVFLRSPAAKERLRPALSQGNLAKTLAAPVTAVIGYDTRFYDRMEFLFPHQLQARSWFASSETLARDTALRNGSLQGAYLIIAARALGLDAGPMSGFDNARVDAEFFAGTSVRSNFLCNLGYGDAAELRPRLPRLPFAEACRVL